MVDFRAVPNKTSSEMIAEALREIGVLAIVLVPIDMIFTQGPIHWRVIAYALGAGFLFLSLGIVLERIRP
jgi:hypothetical protein